MKDNGRETSDNSDNGVPTNSDLCFLVNEIVHSATVTDIHTHLFSPAFGAMSLYGIDDLLTYHYLVAEMFRSAKISPDEYWAKSKTDQADLVWRALFVESTPISEAARGIVTILTTFGLDSNANTLCEARAFFGSQNLKQHLDRVLEMARVNAVVMTNDPFDAGEMEFWKKEPSLDHRFHASLRMDRLLNSWPLAVQFLSAAGFTADSQLSEAAVTEVRRYIDGCIEQMDPRYLAASLPDDFCFPTGDIRDRIIGEILLPTAREHRLPLAMMIGVRRGVNPALRSAGDGVGRADVSAVERMCFENPDVNFLVTFLSRENQHELCVAARKFNNLMPFGCWWFLNNPSIVAEITAERLEMLGTSFIPQHSDARVLEQLIYKWKHSRRVIADCLFDSYAQLAAAGRIVTRAEIERDVERMFSGNFWSLIDAKKQGNLSSPTVVAHHGLTELQPHTDLD